MDPKPPLSVEENNKRVSIYHLREMRDRIAGEIFVQCVTNLQETGTTDALAQASTRMADKFVRHIAASPSTLEK